MNPALATVLAVTCLAVIMTVLAVVLCAADHDGIARRIMARISPRWASSDRSEQPARRDVPPTMPPAPPLPRARRSSRPEDPAAPWTWEVTAYGRYDAQHFHYARRRSDDGVERHYDGRPCACPNAAEYGPLDSSRSEES